MEYLHGEAHVNVTGTRWALCKALGQLPEFKGQRSLVERITPKQSLEATVSVLGKYRVNVDTRSYIEREVFLYGGYEADVMSSLSSIFTSTGSQHGIAIDVGANIGLYSLFFSEYFPIVEAFEPQSYVFTRLLNNLLLNPSARVQAHHLAVGAKPGTATLYSPPPGAGNHGLAGLSSGFYTNWGTEFIAEEVEIVTLDERIIQDVGFIKIDVEGFELTVLQGAERILHEARPLCLLEITQWTQEIFSHSPEDVYAFLHEASYTLVHPVTLELFATPALQKGALALCIPDERMHLFPTWSRRE